MITDTHEFIAPLTDDDVQIISEFIKIEFADENNDFGDVGQTFGLVRDADICGVLLDARKQVKDLADEVDRLRTFIRRLDHGDVE